MKTEKIGLYFGSFNPIHNGHLAIANYVIEHYNLDSLQFIISPQNPFKDKNNIESFANRYNMTNLAISEHKKMFASDIENTFTTPSYTSDVLKYIVNNKIFISSQDNNAEYYFIIGFDNWNTFEKWHDYQDILNIGENFNIIIIPRLTERFNDFSQIKTLIYNIEYQLKLKWLNLFNVNVLYNNDDIPLSTMSSTFIRKQIENNKNIQFYMPKTVVDYIEKYKIYQQHGL